jgi:hypothetical protein
MADIFVCKLFRCCQSEPLLVRDGLASIHLSANGVHSVDGINGSGSRRSKRLIDEFDVLEKFREVPPVERPGALSQAIGSRRANCPCSAHDHFLDRCGRLTESAHGNDLECVR